MSTTYLFAVPKNYKISERKVKEKFSEVFPDEKYNPIYYSSIKELVKAIEGGGGIVSPETYEQAFIWRVLIDILSKETCLIYALDDGSTWADRDIIETISIDTIEKAFLVTHPIEEIISFSEEGK